MASSELDHFLIPAVAQGETLYSVIARCHVYSCCCNAQRTIQRLLGSSTVWPSSEFPSWLPVFAERSHLPMDFIINELLDFRFYKPFSDAAHYQASYQGLASGVKTSVCFRHLSATNRLAIYPTLRFCPRCMEEDFDKIGFTYWHLNHHLPGIFICNRHHVPLHIFEPTLRTLVMPYGLNRVPSLPYSEAAAQFSLLCQQEFESGIGHLDHQRLISLYRNRIKEQGFVSKRGRLKLDEFRGCLQSYWGSLMKLPPFNVINDAIERAAFPQYLLYDNAMLHHPIKHLFLIGELFGSWDQFISAYEDTKLMPIEPISASHECEIPCPAAEKSYALELELLGQGLSMREVSRRTGLSRQETKVLARRHLINVDARPSKVFASTERTIWRQLFFGYSTREIAKFHGISVSVVEAKLRYYPYLVPLRDRIRTLKRRQRYRTIIQKITLEHPEWCRNEVRKAHSRGFAWLAANDREWLEGTLPPPIPLSKRTTWQKPHVKSRRKPKQKTFPRRKSTD